jgi:cytochrome c nitrite reductase small subunit
VRAESVLYAAAVAVGLAAGLGMYTFVYAKGHSYLTNDPAACANCHIMEEQYAAWMKSSHRAAAACNDCHTPEGVVGKYVAKASNGFWHSLAFTTGRHPDPLRIKPHNRSIAEARCRSCHSELAIAIDAGGEPIACTRCHPDVGHRH